LKAEKEVGGFMPVQQQIEAMNKIDEIRNQIEFLGEMQKLNKKQLSQYKKYTNLQFILNTIIIVQVCQSTRP
jgi:hypothetical protein